MNLTLQLTPAELFSRGIADVEITSGAHGRSYVGSDRMPSLAHRQYDGLLWEHYTSLLSELHDLLRMPQVVAVSLRSGGPNAAVASVFITVLTVSIQAPSYRGQLSPISHRTERRAGPRQRDLLALIETTRKSIRAYYPKAP